MIDDEKINEASRKAHDAFWETLAEQFPEIDTGDIPSEESCGCSYKHPSRYFVNHLMARTIIKPRRLFFLNCPDPSPLFISSTSILHECLSRMLLVAPKIVLPVF
jgi:hypothetical protein